MREPLSTITVSVVASVAVHAALLGAGIVFGGGVGPDTGWHRTRAPHDQTHERAPDQEELGENTAADGSSFDTIDGEQLQQAPKWDNDQVSGRLTPPGDIHDPIRGSGVNASALAEARPVSEALRVLPEESEDARVGIADDTAGPVSPFEKKKQARQQPSEADGASAQASSATHSPGEPVRQTNSESQARSEEVAAEYRDGRVEAHAGRKHKIILPKINLAMVADLNASADATLVLRLHVTSAGTVDAVDVEKSSGHVSVDQPWVVAAYSWWFEPKHDATGTAVDDSCLFGIHF